MTSGGPNWLYFSISLWRTENCWNTQHAALIPEHTHGQVWRTIMFYILQVAITINKRKLQLGPFLNIIKLWTFSEFRDFSIHLGKDFFYLALLSKQRYSLGSSALALVILIPLSIINPPWNEQKEKSDYSIEPQSLQLITCQNKPEMKF